MDQIRRKMNSIRFYMITYVGAALLAGAILSLIITEMLDNAMMNQMLPRPDAIAFVKGSNVSITFQGEIPDQPTIIDQNIFDFLKLLRSVTPVAVFSMSVLFSVFLFYKNRIEKPLKILNKGIEKISSQDLDFTLESGNGNELWQLCGAFEQMRGELVQSFESLWRSEENQRSLYRAFAHDLRTPLAVIRGNNDNIKYIAAKNNNWDQAIKSIALSDHAIARIEAYAKQLHELESLDDYRPVYRKTDLLDLADIWNSQFEILSKKYVKQILLHTDVSCSALLDRNLVMRVVDNLMLNALQYAKNKVVFEMRIEENNLEIKINDDGPGFEEKNVKKAVVPFYTTGREAGHAGIGLTVCHRLLEKCQSRLVIEKSSSQGACVSFVLPI